MANGPIDKVKCYPIEAAIWENQGKDGRPYFMVTINRTYTVEEGGRKEYKQTTNLRKQDLPAAALLLEKAWDRINEFEDAVRSREQSARHAVTGEHPPY